MKMANEFVRMRADQSGQQQPQQQFNQPYGGYPGQPYGYPGQPYGVPPYSQQPVQQPVQPQAQQLPPPVQPIIINTASGRQEQAKPAPAPAAQREPRVIIKEVKEVKEGNDFYDIDGFYDNYDANK